VGVSGFLIGSVLGLAVGYFFGRNSERARRSFKDYGVAKATVPKTRTIVFTETRRATVTGIVVGAFLIAIFIGAMNYPDTP
jgi:ABC-type nitrate/sulfonate/bicarbonate transport system permease component